MAKKKVIKKENLGKYFLLGTITAVVLFILFSIIKKEQVPDAQFLHEWSQEMDSAFVKDCFKKYKPQIKDDVEKQVIMKSFCRCMLGKMKTKYGEKEVDKITDAEIKQWDAECRSQLLNPNNIQIK